MVVAVALALLGLQAPANAATPEVFQGHVYASGAGAASADKPQSKLWYNDGSWWALMSTSGGTVNIFRLVGHTWTDTTTVVDERTTSTGDALFSGGKLYVASRTAGTAGAVRVYTFSYSAGTYTRDGTAKTLPGGGTESATIDKDSAGRLWVTFTRGSRVYVSYTDTARTTWAAPFRISGADTAVSGDDISAVVAFDGKIGVLWSDQASVATRFAYRADGGTPGPAGWTVETVLSGSSFADDHLNIKSLQGDDQGRLYAAVKTSKTVSTDPSLLVLTRTAGGSWSAATTATVADGLTRPQIALDKTNKVLYVMQSREGGGKVYYKSSPLSDGPSFSSGRGADFIAWTGASINNVSTTKDPVTAATGLVAIATDEFARRYYHAELSLGATAPGDTTPPPAPTLSPAGGTFTAATSVEMTVAEAGATIRYTIGQGTTDPTDPTSTTGTVYTNRVTVSASQIIEALAVDAAGNASTVTRAAYTITTTGPTSRTVTLNPAADTMVKQAAATSNFGETSPLQADTQDVSGNASTAIHSYVKFTVPALQTGETISSASLSLQAINGTSNGPRVWRTDPDWVEAAMTWSAGRPARTGSAHVGDFGSMAITRVSTTVSGVTGAGDVSFELAPEVTDGMDFASREAATASQPQLVLTVVR